MPVSDQTEDVAPQVVPLGNGRYAVGDASRRHVAFAVAARDTWVFLDGRTYVVPTQSTARRAAVDETSALSAPMPATVVRIEVTPGQLVTRDSALIMLEAMKMELPVKAPRDGRVVAINCRVGELVQPGVPLVELS